MSQHNGLVVCLSKQFSIGHFFFFDEVSLEILEILLFPFLVLGQAVLDFAEDGWVPVFLQGSWMDPDSVSFWDFLPGTDDGTAQL